MVYIYLTELVNEILGIPEEILEISDYVLLKTIEHLSSKLGSIRKHTVTDIKNREEFKIGDFTFNKISVTIDIDLEKGNPLVLTGMAFSYKSNIEKPYKISVHEVSDTVGLHISFAADQNEHTWKDIIDLLEENKARTIASIAHELKHAFDKHKRKGEKALSIIKYRSINDTLRAVSGVPGLREFMFFMYYTTVTEYLVRATEIGTYLKQKGVTKKDFLESLKETETYKTVKQAQDFTYEKMIHTMSSNQELIEVIIKFFDDHDLSGLSNVEIVEKLLKYNFSELKKRAEIIYSMSVYKNSPIFGILSFFGIQKDEIDDEKEKAIADFKKKINKYNDDEYEKFYRKEIAQIHFNSNKILRKLAKLYDYV